MVAFRTTSPCPAYCRSTSKICHLFLLRDEVDAQGEGGKKEEKDGDDKLDEEDDSDVEAEEE